MEQNVKQNNNSKNEFPDNVNIKPTTVNLDANTNTEIKQATNNQNPILGIKPEIKVENSILKTELPHEGTHLNSRTTEMVEKIKYISSGEMIREVYKAFESGEKQSIVLRLVPKELGSIKITLDTIDNVLNAKVEVQNETVGNLIRSNSDLLKQNLLQNGVHINSLNISYQNSEQKQHGFTNQKRRHPFYLPDNDIEEVDDSLITKKMGYNTYEYLA
jgi:flagellar hook-length control protein FliK